MLSLAFRQCDCPFALILSRISPGLQLDIKPSVPLININSTEPNRKNKGICAHRIISGINFLEPSDSGINITLLEGVDHGAGENGDEDDDQDDGAQAPLEGLVAGLAGVAEGYGFGEEVEGFY